MRKARGLLGVIFGLALVLSAGGLTASADTHGNNGTVKIHEGDTEAEPIRSNEPHVCTFHVHGFNFDASSSGTWRIDRHAPTGEGQAAAGTWSADSNGDWRTQVMTLEPGHYKLYVKQTAPMTAGGEKHKVFWVECEGAGATTGGTTTAGTTTSGTTTAGTTTAGTTTSGTTTSGTTTAGTTTSGTTTGGTTTGGTTTAGTTTSGGQGNVTGGNTDLGTSGGAGAATGGGTTGSGAQGNVNVPTTTAAGVSPSISNLPSTSTVGQNTGLAGVGALLTLLGAFLLRRPGRQAR